MLDVGAGSKGQRVYDWVVQLAYVTEWAGRVAAAARSLSDPNGSGLLTRLEEETTIAELARVVGTRWKIEESFQRDKAIGLDQ